MIASLSNRTKDQTALALRLDDWYNRLLRHTTDPQAPDAERQHAAEAANALIVLAGDMQLAGLRAAQVERFADSYSIIQKLAVDAGAPTPDAAVAARGAGSAPPPR